jgi:hypothetical protein
MKLRYKLLGCLSVLTVLLLAGCGQKVNKFESGEAASYFEIGDAYRVIELQEDQSYHIEDCPLNSYIIPAKTIGASGLKLSIENVQAYDTNSLFFEDITSLNKEGVLAVYNYLNIDVEDLSDKYNLCSGTNLYSYNKRISYNGTLSDFNLADYPDYTVVGDVGDVDVYTFKYSDYAIKGGDYLGEGVFKVYVCPLPYVGTFVVNN